MSLLGTEPKSDLKTMMKTQAKKVSVFYKFKNNVGSTIFVTENEKPPLFDS